MTSPTRPLLPAPGGPAARRPVPAPHPAPSRAQAASPRPGPLWLAVYCPWLAGEVLDDGRKPVSIVSEETRRGWVVYRASPEAWRRGVVPGMSVSAAGVICPGMPARPRSPAREQRRLAGIADRMLRFTPVVSVHPPETLLLEVRGSLTLFGGLERLRACVHEELETAGHVHRIAGAPTPMAAERLACWGRECIVEDKSALRSALGDMPAGLLELDARTAGRLKRTGIRTLRGLWRLPADGLARRFGPALVRELDRLQGRRPDPRPLHHAPLCFSAVLMLDWATGDLAQIERGVGYLLEQWVAELRRSARGTSGFSIECLPERGNETLRVDIGLRRVSRDLEHLQRLAGERLSRLRLNGPVAGLVLASDRLHPLGGESGQLFETSASGRQDGEAAAQWQQSEELLAARLGGRGLDMPQSLAEHRPEHAWRLTAPGPGGPEGSRPANGRRPLWLLDPPRPLPWRSSPYEHRPGIVRSPERIEAGWWDRHDQRRDYYSATDQLGRRLWVFWDLKRERWYLHGLFA